MGITVTSSIDPTNAIVVGAAYFAATKASKTGDVRSCSHTNRDFANSIFIQSRNPGESEELFSAKIDNNPKGLFYRIVRDDGAYDSGLKQLTDRIVEELPLQPDAFNTFDFTAYDAQNRAVATDFSTIEIAQGKYSVARQVLPEDISLVKDDAFNNDTKLDSIFRKNAILPAKGRNRSKLVEL